MTILAFGLLAALLILLAAIFLLIGRWSLGRPAKVDWIAGIARLPRSYLHDVHEAVSRESHAGLMHAMTAGGLLATLAMLVLMAWIGWRGAMPGALLLLALIVMIGGSLLVARRRWPRPAPRFSRGRFQLLPALILIFAFGTAMIGFGEIGWIREFPDGQPPGQILAAVTLVLLATQLAWGPLKHILAGTVNLVAHPRPARFGASVPSADLVPLDLEG